MSRISQYTRGKLESVIRLLLKNFRTTELITDLKNASFDAPKDQNVANPPANMSKPMIPGQSSNIPSQYTIEQPAFTTTQASVVLLFGSFDGPLTNPNDGETIKLIDTDGIEVTYQASSTETTGTASGGKTFFALGDAPLDTIKNLETAIAHASNGHNGDILTSHTILSLTLISMRLIQLGPGQDGNRPIDNQLAGVTMAPTLGFGGGVDEGLTVPAGAELTVGGELTAVEVGEIFIAKQISMFPFGNDLVLRNTLTDGTIRFEPGSEGKVSVTGPLVINSNSGVVVHEAAVPLTEHVSLFATEGSGETSTLDAGSEGQIKILARKTDGAGDMVTTVISAGWKSTGTGTITFDTIGDCCVLQYIDSKWFCISNNGAAFA